MSDQPNIPFDLTSAVWPGRISHTRARRPESARPQPEPLTDTMARILADAGMKPAQPVPPIPEPVVWEDASHFTPRQLAESWDVPTHLVVADMGHLSPGIRDEAAVLPPAFVDAYLAFCGAPVLVGTVPPVPLPDVAEQGPTTGALTLGHLVNES